MGAEPDDLTRRPVLDIQEGAAISASAIAFLQSATQHRHAQGGAVGDPIHRAPATLGLGLG